MRDDDAVVVQRAETLNIGTAHRYYSTGKLIDDEQVEKKIYKKLIKILKKKKKKISLLV